MEADRGDREVCSYFTVGIAGSDPPYSTNVFSSFVFVVCCIGSSLCDKLITLQRSPTGAVRVCLTVCYLETSPMRRPRPELGCYVIKKRNVVIPTLSLQ